MSDKIQERQLRGALTQNVVDLSKKLLGYEIGRAELRLMPYVQYVMVNEQVIDPSKVNVEERRIMQKWREAGHFAGGMGGCGLTKEFWDILCEIIFEAYVDVEKE